MIPDNDRSATPAPVRFRVECANALLDHADIQWPASWTVTRLEPASNGMTWIEVADTAAPAEVDGRVCSPVLQRDRSTDTVRVLDYGVVQR